MWRIVAGMADCLGNVATWHVYHGDLYVTTYTGNLYMDGSIEDAKHKAQQIVDYFTQYPLPDA